MTPEVIAPRIVVALDDPRRTDDEFDIRPMDLLPRRLPGRIDRKAAAYAAQIKQLRAEGFTYVAIREALADVGVALSERTVRREVLRRVPEQLAHTGRSRSTLSTVERARPKAPMGTKSVAEPTRVEPAAASPIGPLPGRGIAEAFTRDRITNPLLRKEPTK